MSDFLEVLISFIVMVVVAGGEYWLKKRKERQEHDDYWEQKRKNRRKPGSASRSRRPVSRTVPTAPTDFFEPDASAATTPSRPVPSSLEPEWSTSAWLEAAETPSPAPTTLNVPSPEIAPRPSMPTAATPRPRQTEKPHPYVAMLRRNSRAAVVMMEILSPPKALRKQ